MLVSKILRKKDTFKTADGRLATDLIYNTFSFPQDTSVSMTAVGEYEKMRPDLLCNRIYGDQSKWDAMLKFNGISNPFSIDFGDILYAIPFASLDAVYSKPRKIEERAQKTDEPINGITDPDKQKDTNRTNNISNTKGELPPNINKPGDKNVKVKDGKLIFGEDVTSINKNNCPVPISRSRLQKALIKDKLFL